MPSFSFRGFQQGVPVSLSLTQGVANVSNSVSEWGAPSGTPTGNFQIELIDQCTEVVAPHNALFRATGFTGFAYSEPVATGNVYDVTQHRITVQWDFGDPEYVPLVTPNLPAAMRNTNTAVGPIASHTWNTPGPKFIYAYAFDDQGNWGTASYVYGSGGQQPAIADPNVFFAGNRTICLSQANDFSGAPIGSTNVTNISALRSAMQALWQAPTPIRSMRILVRAGETFDNTGFLGNIGGGSDPGNPRDNLKGVHVNRFGTGANPRFRQTIANTPTLLSFPGGGSSLDARQFVVSNIEFEGGWDTTTETGHPGGVGSLLSVSGYILFNRVRFINMGAPTDKETSRPFVFSDCEVYGWDNYAMFADTPRFVLLGCDIHQHEDALIGIGQETGGQQTTELGNRHGAHRSGSRPILTLFSACSFRSATGWFPTGGGNTNPQSFGQACSRMFQHFNAAGMNTRTVRHYHVVERCGFEGGDAVFALGPSQPPNNWMENNVLNFLIDGCIFVGTSLTYEPLLGVSISGITIRNSLFRRFADAVIYTNSIQRELNISYSTGNGGVGLGPVEVYNNTFLIETPSGEMDVNYSPVVIDSRHVNAVNQNNVVRVLNRSAFLNNDVLPLDTAALDTIEVRQKGLRWNFRPVIIGVGAARQAETGTAGPVPVGGWVRISYPNQTGQCLGAGVQLTQTLVTGNSTQKHQVSMTWRPSSAQGGNEGEFRRMTDTALFPNSKGGVTFDFPVGQTYFRIQNNTTREWPQDRDIWVLFDQSDRLMAHAPGTDMRSNVIATHKALLGSSAFQSATGIVAQFDSQRQTRGQKLTSLGLLVNRQPSRGWIDL